MKKTFIWIVGIIILAWLIFAIVNTPKQTSSKEPIRIGAIISETGVAAAFGEMSHKGIDLAAKEINSNGGVDGRMVEVTYEDDRTDPKAAAGAYQKLTGINKVDAILGSNFDFVTQPLFSLAKAGDTIVISPSNPRIPGAFDTNEHSFVMMTEFEKIIRGLEKEIKDANYKQLGILRFESAFGEEIEKTLNKVTIEDGKKAIVAETYKQIGNNDYRTQILKFKQAGVDLIFLDMIAIDPYTFVTQAKQLNYNPKILTHIGIQDALGLQNVDPNVFNGVIVLDWNFSPDGFVKKFSDAYGIKPDKSANRAYDAVYVLAQAISRAKNKAEIPMILEKETFKTPNEDFKFNENHAAASSEVRVEIVKDGKVVPYIK